VLEATNNTSNKFLGQYNLYFYIGFADGARNLVVSLRVSPSARPEQPEKRHNSLFAFNAILAEHTFIGCVPSSYLSFD
jgi:hypothetical protein